MSATPRRRRPGTGTVFRRKDGRWVARHPTVAREKTFHTKKEAEAWLAAINRALKPARAVPPPPLTLGVYLETWLTETLIPTANPNTAMGYVRYLRSHVIPLLGKHRLAELTPAHIQRAQTVFSRDYSPNTVSVMLSGLRKALRAAVAQGVLPRSPADGVTWGKAVAQRRVPDFTPELAARIRAAVRGTDAELPVALALFAGLRLAEVYGLEWGDFDDGLTQFHVRRQWQYVDRLVRGEKAAYVLAPPKRSKSRLVPVCGPLRGVLVPHRRPAGPVCATANGEHVGFKSAAGRVMRPLRAAGLTDFHFHDLRHFFSSALYAQGVDVLTVQRLLGHSHASMTAHYTQSQTAQLHAAVAVLDEFGWH